ncbi:MAG: flavodoxin [Eubacteriales bacterium]
MSKVAVIYWSGTGNTEAMANAVEEGAKSAGAEVCMFTPDDFDMGKVADCTAFAFGCPSMGAEVLEETEYQPMWDDAKAGLSGKPVALFGSYGWGDGEWMRDWEEDAKGAGVTFVDSFICNEMPDDEATDACKALGAKLAGC